MIPNRKQYQNWSLPSKWTFWAGIMGIVSLVFAIIGQLPNETLKPQVEDSSARKLNSLVLQVAQELRYNSEWLSGLAIGYEKKSEVVPIGKMKVSSLVRLANSDFEKIVQHSYGEEKYIYQEIYRLSDLATAIGAPNSWAEITSFNARSEYNLHDVIFLNNFLRWYLRPLVEERLSASSLYSLGWNPFPREKFAIYDLKEIKLKYFVHDGEPLENFGHYLGLID